MNFSGKKRSEIIKSIQKKEIDLLIIGGGITGAGIALDATTRGFETVLFDMQDFAEGTSSRSTKLIHGGLRYLKQFEIKLVSEVGKERAIVYENGPHVTSPEWMLLPIHKGGSFGKFTTSIGLRVYDFLAGVKKTERRKMLSVKETIEKAPLIKREGLLGGGYYVEYRTDDARLTIEVIKKSVEKGVTALNYTKVESLIYENGKVKGVNVIDMLTQEQYAVYGKNVVNATGPWGDALREQDQSLRKKTLRLTKGVHIVIDQKNFPLKQAIYYDTKDGRMVFAIPRDGKTYVGTTDTFYKEDISTPTVTKEDCTYLLQTIHDMFPSIRLSEDEVESSWAGLRPLIHEEGKDPSEISRKDEIWKSDSGLITIAGGKLTGYRKMAEMVVDQLASLSKDEIKIINKRSQTKNLAISGGDVGGSQGFNAFQTEQVTKLVEFNLDKEVAMKLVRLYGSNITEIIRMMDEVPKIRGVGMPPYIIAMIRYSIECEMTIKPVDFFIRRTGAIYFDYEWVQKWKQPVIRYMVSYYKWSRETKQCYESELEKALELAALTQKMDKRINIR
ncbi:glycerol-3-phosphate dehydrogenase/oxidase [Litchfieldia salsa]|uniref:Glycerol-3-phosphate dehydrogenase n=1 Tax=Litchfieldia salsa TaxID=930152 RepID=A0A1H0NXI5_9BACI|nr:glycerol-3-phosphate dehydrogenase/oxidase [Litchfieldia salsa]SDO97381.1 homodimeric glycerol 3-phosphate dehydrogenase (quinone) [Litchfieldia salsa]